MEEVDRKRKPGPTNKEFRELVGLQRQLAQISVKTKRMADSCGLTRRALGERMGCSSPSTVQRLVKGGAYKASLETLARFAWACGYELKVELIPRKDQ